MEGESRVLLEVPLMNFILRISNEIKWKVKAWCSQSVIDELHSSNIQGVQRESKNGVTRSVIDEVVSSDSQRDQTEG